MKTWGDGMFTSWFSYYRTAGSLLKRPGQTPRKGPDIPNPKVLRGDLRGPYAYPDSALHSGPVSQLQVPCSKDLSPDFRGQQPEAVASTKIFLGMRGRFCFLSLLPF